MDNTEIKDVLDELLELHENIVAYQVCDEPVYLPEETKTKYNELYNYIIKNFVLPI